MIILTGQFNLRASIPEENDFSLSSATKNPQLHVEHNELHSTILGFVLAWSCTGTKYAVTASVSWNVQQLCHV